MTNSSDDLETTSSRDDLDPTSSTDNLTYTADYSCLYTQTFLLLCFCVLSTTIISNLFGNILILISVIKFKSRFKGSLYVLISNLAVSDLLLGISLIMYPIELFFPELDQVKAFCFLRLCVLLVAFSSSVLSLLLISLHRYAAVVYPMKHYRLMVENPHNIRYVLMAVWVISFITGTLQVTANTNFRLDNFICRNGLMLSDEIELFNATAVLVEFTVSVVSYGMIIHTLRRKSTKLSERTRQRLKVKTSRMILVFIYAMCWLPYIISTFLIVTNQSERTTERLFCVREHLVLMGVLNSGINWMIYGLTNQKFRISFKAILTCKSQRPSAAYILPSAVAAISTTSLSRDSRQ